MKPIPNLYLVGLTGRAGAGKSTVAGILAERHNAVVLTFAHAIRHEIATAWQLDRRLLEDPHTRATPLPALALDRCTDLRFLAFAEERLANHQRHVSRSPLELMQWWGTEYRRAQDTEYWLRIAADSICAAMRRGHYRIVIEDVCFPNEADLVRELGGQLWRILNTNADAVPPRHISERFVRWLNAHASIRNDGPLDGLERAVTHHWIDAFEEVPHGVGQ